MALAGVVVTLLSCGEAGHRSETPGSRSTSSSGVGAWPDPEAEAVDCLIAYPNDLRQQAYAFDGTVTDVQVAEYDEQNGLPPVRVEVTIHELFRGEGLEDRVALRTVESKVPPGDVVGTRILAATDHSFNLLGCGYTRPYSPSEASRWQRAFANVPAVECGKEVRDCSLGEPTPVPATCKRDSIAYAIAANIDQGGFPFDVIGCDERFLSLRLDLGANACPPEATKEQRKDCAREKSSYFIKRGAVWEIITYESRTSCDSVQVLMPTFPTEYCSPARL